MTGQRGSYRIVPDTASFSSVIGQRLQRIYKEEFSEILVNRIMALSAERYPSWSHWDERDIMLITYGNSVRSEQELPLETLSRFVYSHLRETINCIHILPFFPYTSDDGFAVSDYEKVNPTLGSWEHIEVLSRNYYLMADLVINHVSSAHPWFINYLKQVSPGRDYFIENKTGFDYSMVARPRTSALFTEFETAAGPKQVWTTFGPDQVDLNFSNPDVLIEMIRIMILYISKGVRFIRLDAIAYLWKCLGTVCLHMDETHEIVKLLRDVASYVRPGTIIITETNVPNRENWSYFGNNDEAHMVYQFSLPPLLLHSVFFGNSRFLTAWAQQIPEIPADQTFLNYTSSHDGIGVRPLEGLVPANEISALVSGMASFGGLTGMKMNTNGSRSPYELNITWYDAMQGTFRGRDDYGEQRFLTTQAIMMSMKGIPAFYIHSLLATPNNLKGVAVTGHPRTINRAVLEEKEVLLGWETDSPQRRIFFELVRLIKIRRNIRAFHPDCRQEILETNSNALFGFRRADGDSKEIYCVSNLGSKEVSMPFPAKKIKKGYDLISEEKIAPGDHILFKPYQTRWIQFL
ncbi:MAG TPA: alpha-amylase family glycosyl hydrolase [Bacteroidales bacterium]|nr:alpha-amylase family glycosyl hydrolase [Bacteroidales bacterium]